MDKNTCSCPAFVFRGSCKHLERIRTIEESSTPNIDETNKILEYISGHKEHNIEKVYRKFGEEKVKKLLERGEIYEHNNTFEVLD